MTTQNEHIVFDDFISSLNAVDKKQILQNISWKIGRASNVDMTWLAEQLLLAEEKQSSGIGNGVAIVHLKSTPLQKPFILLARLDRPVEFNAVDGEPVDLVCAVLSPQMDGPLHLQRLARATRIFRDQTIIDKLRRSSSEEEMALILSPENRHSLAA